MRRMIWAWSGTVTLLALWLGPLPSLATGAFSAHMTLHMGIVAVAAPCLAFAIAGSRHDPVCRWPGWFPPIPLSLIELIWVWAWHSPGLHHWARHTALGFALEQSTFLVAGLLVWLSAFGGGGLQRMDRVATGIGALLLTSMHMTLLGALLALTPRPLYVHGALAVSTFTALDDQHLGGAIMLFVGGASYLAGGLWLTAGLMRSTRPEREAAA